MTKKRIKNLLIVNASNHYQAEANEAITSLTKEIDDFKVYHTANKNIQSCKGCYVCMLNTPGLCCINDEYQGLFKLLLNYDHVVFVVDTSFGFLNHQAKNVIDRMFPLANILLCYRNGSIRHLPRYQKSFYVSLLYTGDGNENLLNHWMERFADNLNAHSYGAFHLSKAEELKKCIQ